ncbi:MAG: DUF2520 domain-containing protein [Bacteroidia bacterium]|nr:DUF2520 domain-containing protein [Bacteroidia bacterium]
MLLIVGAGGVGRAFARRLHEIGEPVGLLRRAHQSINEAFPSWSDIQEVPFSLIEGAFLCVKDHQIFPTAQKLLEYLPERCVIVHTAGSVPLSVLSDLYGERAGVIYPLQSFIPDETVEWGSFPIFWEGHSQVERWALLLAGGSAVVHHAASEERLRIHIGAVFAANFLNALFHVAERLAMPTGDRRFYLPLAETVLRRLYTFSPEVTQTGPARRRDILTIDKHYEYLREKFPELAEIYSRLTSYIQEWVCGGAR